MAVKETTLETLKKDLQKNLSEKRYAHTASVTKTALDYAKLFEIGDEDKNKLEFAAWAHDTCKELDNNELLTLAKHYGIKIYQEDEAVPNVIHARVGAAYVEDKYEVYDPEVLAAIREHTLGAINMSEISKVLYVADFVEPLRDKHYKENHPDRDSFCDPVRKLMSDKQLDQAVLEAMDIKVSYVIRTKGLIHPLCIEARNSILLEINSDKE